MSKLPTSSGQNEKKLENICFGPRTFSKRRDQPSRVEFLLRIPPTPSKQLKIMCGNFAKLIYC